MYLDKKRFMKIGNRDTLPLDLKNISNKKLNEFYNNYLLVYTIAHIISNNMNKLEDNLINKRKYDQFHKFDENLMKEILDTVINSNGNEWKYGWSPWEDMEVIRENLRKFNK